MALPPSAHKRSPTIYDVAALAGVSHQSVSRFVKGTTIRDATREAIEAAIEELGFRPNQTARALATNRSDRLGALVYQLHELGPNRIVAGATRAAREAGYLLDIVSLDPENDHEIARAIELLEGQQLAGVFAMAPTLRIREALAAIEHRVPFLIDSEPLYDATPGTESLNTIGARLATQHLIDLGHRRILHVSGPGEWISAINRSAVYRETMERAGLEPLPVVEGDWTAASGYATLHSLPDPLDVTAIFVANDQMAMGVLRALWERGVAVPTDVSVIGFDDVPESEFTVPPLSTMRLDFAERGRAAVQELVGSVEGRVGAAHATANPEEVSLVARASTARRH
ncbi:substrate-binding domain-containing protein [Microbacteriaceae bacterium VKM Ac-2854]|nr:substrate-binding domain-containing protein [Microbacteriaceae bacterium VKM Ac-2854]